MSSKAVCHKRYWEFAEPALDAAGTMMDLLECVPLSRLPFKTATCSVTDCPLFVSHDWIQKHIQNQSGGQNILWFKHHIFCILATLHFCQRAITSISLLISISLPHSCHVLLLYPFSEMLKLVPSTSSGNYCTTGNLKALMCLTWCLIMSESKQTQSPHVNSSPPFKLNRH